MSSPTAHLDPIIVPVITGGTVRDADDGYFPYRSCSRENDFGC